MQDGRCTRKSPRAPCLNVLGRKKLSFVLCRMNHAVGVVHGIREHRKFAVHYGVLVSSRRVRCLTTRRQDGMVAGFVLMS